jgi:MFS family permease
MASSVGAQLVGSACIMTTAGVDSNNILVYAQELIPEPVRRHAMFLELNFVHLGSLALAALAYGGQVLPTGSARLVAALVPILGGVVLWAIRRPLPESSRWKRSCGNPAHHGTAWIRRLKTRLVVAMAFSFANTTGFSLFTYAYGAQFLPRHFRSLMLASTSTAFIVGLGARWLAALPPRLLLAGSYLIATASTIALTGARDPDYPAFWLIVLVLSGATSVSYLAEDTFKSDVWPSRVRGRATSFVRIGSLIACVAVELGTHHFTHRQFLHAMTAVWAAGALAAVFWAMRRPDRRAWPKRD